jgi:hypothetical protein
MLYEDEEEISFTSSAFDVVNSWLGGSNDREDQHEEDEEKMTPSYRKVQLYRPTNKASENGVVSSGAFGNGLNGGGMTAEELEMKKKILRKPRIIVEEPDENASDKDDDDEEEDLIKYKKQKLTHRATSSSDGAFSDSPFQSKQKMSAQDELLAKLRDEAAKRKAKNLKQKKRQQRKKEEQKRVQMLSVS